MSSMGKEKYLIVGYRLAELEKDNAITFAQNMTTEELVELAEELWKRFLHNKDCNYFTEFVGYELIEMQREKWESEKYVK